jgi:hypothetical protein
MLRRIIIEDHDQLKQIGSFYWLKGETALCLKRLLKFDIKVFFNRDYEQYKICVSFGGETFCFSFKDQSF